MKSRKIGPARQAVEAVLKTATVDAPLSTEKIAAQTGLEPALVRTHVGNIINECLAHNLRPNSKNTAYVWGPAPKPEPLPQLRDAPAGEPPRWQPEPDRCTRPGAMDAYRIPSLGDAERKRPLIIGARVEPVGVNGGRI